MKRIKKKIKPYFYFKKTGKFVNVRPHFRSYNVQTGLAEFGEPVVVKKKLTLEEKEIKALKKIQEEIASIKTEKQAIKIAKMVSDLGQGVGTHNTFREYSKTVDMLRCKVADMGLVLYSEERKWLERLLESTDDIVKLRELTIRFNNLHDKYPFIDYGFVSDLIKRTNSKEYDLYTDFMDDFKRRINKADSDKELKSLRNEIETLRKSGFLKVYRVLGSWGNVDKTDSGELKALISKRRLELLDKIGKKESLLLKRLEDRFKKLERLVGSGENPYNFSRANTKLENDFTEFYVKNKNKFSGESLNKLKDLFNRRKRLNKDIEKAWENWKIEQKKVVGSYMDKMTKNKTDFELLRKMKNEIQGLFDNKKVSYHWYAKLNDQLRFYLRPHRFKKVVNEMKNAGSLKQLTDIVDLHFRYGGRLSVSDEQNNKINDLFIKLKTEFENKTKKLKK